MPPKVSQFQPLSPFGAFLISSIPSLAAGGLSAFSQFMTNKRNTELQWEMWRATNEYNSPKAQMQRYIDAGLNPNLIYGQSNTAQPVSVGVQQPMNFDFLAQTGNNALNQFNVREHSPFDLELKAIQIELDSLEYGFNQGTILDRVKMSGNQAKLSDKQIELVENQVKIAIQEALSKELDNAIKTLEKTAREIDMQYDFHNQLETAFPNMTNGQRMFITILTSIFEFIGVPLQSIITKKVPAAKAH